MERGALASSISRAALPWVRDWGAVYSSEGCADCANLAHDDTIGPGHILRGGEVGIQHSQLRAATREPSIDLKSYPTYGVRCTREP